MTLVIVQAFGLKYIVNKKKRGDVGMNFCSLHTHSDFSLF